MKASMPRLPSALALLLALLAVPALAAPPPDLWTDEVLARIRDQGTLNAQLIPRFGYFEVFYDSEIEEANWADSAPPYELHRNDTIRIHGYLAAPLFGGPHPAIVVGHGHGGRGSPEFVVALAALGYVALSIDGPRAGGSTGGPEDTEQAWISVEELQNEPSPSFGYLYHYAYAGMRGLTLLEYLAGLDRPWKNPLGIAKDKLGVLGASMGGQFTYYINGVDARVKAAVAVAVAGDWYPLLFYPGSWLYHGLYYYTRDGLQTLKDDDRNMIGDVCSDPTLHTFRAYFDPIAYANTQHGPLLTIIGTHDQYFGLPAINRTYDRVRSAGTNPRFRKNVTLVPNGKHGVLQREDDLPTLLSLVRNARAWFRHAFADGPRPPETPRITLSVEGGDMVFRARVVSGDRHLRRVDLHFATQVDAAPPVANDFARLRLRRRGDHYEGKLAIGSEPPNGPPALPENVLYFATVKDNSGFTVTSKMHYRLGELSACDDFLPTIDHFPRDQFPVPPPPPTNCACLVP